MFQFAIKRLLGAVPTMLLITTVSFFLMRAAPGGPFDKERVVQPDEMDAGQEPAGFWNQTG